MFRKLFITIFSFKNHENRTIEIIFFLEIIDGLILILMNTLFFQIVSDIFCDIEEK